MKGITLSKHLILLAGLFCIGLSFLQYTDTHAVSVYDNTIQPDTTLELRSPDGLIIRDMTTQWAGAIASTCEHGSLFNSAVTGGGSWFVDSNTNEDAIRVYWSADRLTPLEFYTSPYDQYIITMPNQQVGACIIQLGNDGNYIQSASLGYHGSGSYNLGHYGGAYGNNPWQPWLVNWEINYPVDYEGEIPPAEMADPAPDLSEDIKMYWKYEDRKITLKNETPIPPLDLNTMQCRYMVVSVQTEVAVLDNFANCSHDNIQVVEVEEYGDYQVIMTINYDINDDGVILPDFEQIAEVSYTLTINGESNEGNAGAGGFTEVNTPWEDCLTANEFPFIQIESCLGNISKITSLLTFDRVKFGSGWSTNNGCHTLGTIGEWLPMTNKTVCPMFPETMRNIITPFISAGLGLMALKFLINRNGNSEGNW